MSKTALKLIAAAVERGLGIGNAFRIGGGTSDLNQVTTIFRSKAGRGGLSVTLPEDMVRSFDLKEGDKLSWEVETRETLGPDGLAKKTDIVIVVTPVWSSRKREKPKA